MRTVLIGLGMVADTYLRAFADTNALRLHGIHARSAAARAAFADRAEALTGARPKDYPDLAAILADGDVEGIVLATPPDAREEWVRALAGAGKPILMEKPVERDAAAAARLVALCEAAGVTLGIVLQHRARPASAEAKRRLDRGDFGDVGLVSISVPWWRPQSYYDQPGRGAYARDGGGVMITQAIHAIDLALWLAGPVRAVQAMARTSRFHRMEAEDFVAAGLDFDNGAVGSLIASTADFPGSAESVTLQTDAAALVLKGGALDIHWRDGTTDTVGAAAGTGSGADPMAFSHAFHLAMLEDFAAAVATGRPPLAPGASVLGVHRLIDAIALSSRLGRRVDLAEIAA